MTHDQRPESPDSSNENFWATGARPATPAPAPVARRKRPLLKKILIGGGLAIVLLVILTVSAGLSIVGAMVPGIIEKKAAESIAGKVTVRDVSLTWGGPQVIGEIDLASPDGSRVGTLQVRGTAGIWSVLTGYLGGSIDAGVLQIKGKAAITRDASGVTNFERALAPPAGAARTSPPATGSPPSPDAGVLHLGSSVPIRATISVADLDVTYTDAASGSSYAIRGFNAKSDIDLSAASGVLATLDLSAAVGSAASPTGSLSVAARYEAPARNGSVRLTDGSITAKVNAAQAPLDVIDALTLQQGRLAAALGDKATVNFSISGDMKNAQATITADTAGATADLAFHIKEGVLTASKPGSLFASGKAIRALVPAVEAALAGQDVAAISQFPDVTVELRSLSAAIPAGAPRIDLRGTAIDLSVATTPLTGTVVIDPSAGPRPFHLEPIDLNVSTGDLAGDTTVRLSTRAAIEGRPAGTVNVDLAASRLLNAAGEPSPESAALRGSVSLSEIATAIAQPLVESFGIDLPGDAGPTMGVFLTANASPSTDGASTTTALDARIESRNFNATAAIDLAAGTLKTRDKGIAATLASAGAIASRFLSPESGYSLAPTGSAEVRIPTLEIKLPTAGSAFDLAGIHAVYDATISGMKVIPADASAGSIDVASIKAGGTLRPGAAPRIDLRADMSHERAPFSLTAGLDLDGILSVHNGTTGFSPANAKPRGSIEFKDAPVSLARVIPRSAAGDTPGTATPIDLAALLEGVVGPTATITITSTPRGEAIDVAASVRAANLNADLDAGVEDRALDVRKAAAVATISPPTVRSLVGAFAPGLAQPPVLEETTRATLQVAPVRIPLSTPIFGGFSPDVANTPDATVTITLPDRTLVRGLALRHDDGTSRDLGSVGIESFRFVATVPPALLAGPGARWSKQASATIEGRLLSGPQEALLSLNADATATVSATADAGKFPLDRLNATVSLSQISVAGVERLAAQERGMISEAIGDSAGVKVTVALTTPPEATSFDQARIDLAAVVETPRLRIPEPVRFRVLPDRLDIESPIRLTWDVEPRWANRFLTPATIPGQPPATPAARMTKPSTVRATVTRLALARGEGVGPLKPGIFGLAADAEVPSLELTAADGSLVVMDAATLKIAAVSATRDSSDVINLDIRVAGATVSKQGAAPARAQDMSVSVALSNLADEHGQVNASAAAADIRGDLPVVPVPLLDVFARQEGLLTDALGPVAEATIRASRLSRTGGTLDVRAKSPRASASIQGSISEDVFVTSQPLNVTVTQVSPELTRRLLKGVPLVGAIEKTPNDKPATVVGTNLNIPMSGDMTKLNGKVVVDPGEATFLVGGDFGSILQAVHQRTRGRAGQRIEPLTVDIASGVATFQRWTLPLGEFLVRTEGTVNLVNQSLDVVTWLPVGALTDEAIGLFKAGGGLSRILGGSDQEIFGVSTLLPWRTRGSFGNTRTQPDLELFAKEFVRQIKPDDLIKRGIEDLLKRPERK